MPKARVNRVNIYHEVTGRGFPLAFCHEYAGSYESWRAQVEFFSRNHRVVTYNARGYPPSDVPSELEDYSQEQAVEDLYGLLRHLEIEQAYICGLSMGGNVALNFGIAYPSMAKGLVVAGTGTGSTDPERFRRQVVELAERLETQGMEGMSHYTSTPTRVQLRRKDPEAWAEFDRLFRNHSALGSAMTFRGVLARRPPIFDLKPKLRELRVPTLILVGDEDVPCIEPAIFMKRNITTSGLVVFPQTGHTLNLEEPALFNHTVQHFLSAVEEGRWAEYDPDTAAEFLINPEPGAG
ncbi:MAG: alpha/beta hydrolase [Dehalococcoidia bacterium]